MHLPMITSDGPSTSDSFLITIDQQPLLLQMTLLRQPCYYKPTSTSIISDGHPGRDEGDVGRHSRQQPCHWHGHGFLARFQPTYLYRSCQPLSLPQLGRVCNLYMFCGQSALWTNQPLPKEGGMRLHKRKLHRKTTTGIKTMETKWMQTPPHIRWSLIGVFFFLVPFITFWLF